MKRAATIAVALTCSVVGMKVQPDDDDSGTNGCRSLPGYAALKTALDSATATETSGLNNKMGDHRRSRRDRLCGGLLRRKPRSPVAWQPGDSRAESEYGQFLQPGRLFEQRRLRSAERVGAVYGEPLFGRSAWGSLFGLQESNPVSTEAAYQGPSSNHGTASDPLLGQKIGGVKVFGGGLALYTAAAAPTASATAAEQVVGGVGVSGDTSCADHNIRWRVRHNLGLDHMANIAGVSGDATRPDHIIFDITPNPSGGTGISAGGFGHPTCINAGNPATIPAVIP
jgi:hypothetical protein